MKHIYVVQTYLEPRDHDECPLYLYDYHPSRTELITRIWHDERKHFDFEGDNGLKITLEDLLNGEFENYFCGFTIGIYAVTTK